MTRKFIAMVAAALITAVPSARAQQYNDVPVNDLHINYGYFTITQTAAVLGGVFATAFSGGNADLERITSTGNITVGYEHRINNWLWLGGELGGEKETLYMGKDDSGAVDKSDITSFCVLATAKANWLRREHFAMYSKVRLGAMYLPTNGTSEKLAFSPHISPVAFEAGSQSALGFLELGLGVQGVIIGGVRFRF